MPDIRLQASPSCHSCRSVPCTWEGVHIGTLVRLLPNWYVDAGTISLYYASRAQLPAKTRAFIDFVSEAFESEGLAHKLAAG